VSVIGSSLWATCAWVEVVLADERLTDDRRQEDRAEEEPGRCCGWLASEVEQSYDEPGGQATR
jgi:hypothetical protein